MAQVEMAQAGTVQVRPLLHVSSRRVAQLGAALEHVLTTWCEAWDWPRRARPAVVEAWRDAEDGALSASPHKRFGSSAAGWQLLCDASVPAAQVWIRLPRTAEAEVRGVLFGGEAGAPPAGGTSSTATGEPDLAGTLARNAWSGLIAALCDLLAPKSSAFDPMVTGRTGTWPMPQPVSGEAGAWCAAVAAFGRPWSGALEFDLPLLGDARNDPFRVLIGGRRVAAILAGEQVCAGATATGVDAVTGQPSLAPLRQALARHTLALSAQLDAVELTLGDLRSLRPGDVIPLPHRLDHPLTAHGPDGVALCSAWLGSKGPRRAVQLMPSTTSHLHTRSNS